MAKMLPFPPPVDNRFLDAWIRAGEVVTRLAVLSQLPYTIDDAVLAEKARLLEERTALFRVLDEYRSEKEEEYRRWQNEQNEPH